MFKAVAESKHQCGSGTARRPVSAPSLLSSRPSSAFLPEASPENPQPRARKIWGLIWDFHLGEKMLLLSSLGGGKDAAGGGCVLHPQGAPAGVKTPFWVACIRGFPPVACFEVTSGSPVSLDPEGHGEGRRAGTGAGEARRSGWRWLLLRVVMWAL